MKRLHVLAVAALATALPAIASLAPLSAQDRGGGEKRHEPCACGEGREERLERRKLEVARALTTKLPGNPFVDVKIGDFWVYSMRRLSGDKPVERATLVWKVAEQEGDDVRVTEAITAGAGSPWLGKSRWFNRQDPPTLANVFPSSAGRGRLVHVTDVGTADERHAAGGEVFVTRRLNWTASYEPDGGAPGDVACFTGSLWHTNDARGSIIGLQLKYLGMDDAKVTVELVGYGSDGKADWGRAPDAK